MDISKLKKYMIIPNYRKLCELLNLKVASGNSKMSQLKELERYFKYRKEGNKFIIEEIYTDILEKINARKDTKGNNRIEFPNFIISKEDENKIRVYKIVLNNNIYIGSTIKGFRERFRAHHIKDNPVPHIFDMFEDGATFDIVEVCERMIEPEIRALENKYINKYKTDSKWNLINSKDAWSYIPNYKQKYKTIKIKEEDYEKALKVLRDSNLLPV